MKLRHILLGLGLTCLSPLISPAEENVKGKHPYEVRYISRNRSFVNAGTQQAFRDSESWKKLDEKLGGWQVLFGEHTGKPHKCWGKSLSLPQGSPEQTGRRFLSDFLKDYSIQDGDLVFQSAPLTKRFQYIHFHQKHQGIRVLDSHYMLKTTLSGELVQFSCDLFSNISVNTTPTLSLTLAIDAAKQGIKENIHTIEAAASDLFILPIPAEKLSSFHLVYKITLHTAEDAQGLPGQWECLVDAQTGKLHSRKNRVVQFMAPDVTVNGTVYPTHLYNPSDIKSLANLKVSDGTTTYYTDSAGFVSISGGAPANLTFYLEGRWAKVLTGGSTPSFTLNVQPGQDTISFDNNSTIQERCGFYHVNVVHDYMRSFFTTWDDTQFPNMDNALPTNIDLTSGNCNAFYNGTSINFYALANGCNNLAQTADVVYHEYGHGISDKFYQWQGSSFNNGAMGEGYSDIWGLAITESPLLGVGFYTANQDPIRRYDINPKIYPQDIQGEVHADGEIIAGAWWDAGLTLGIPYMMDLFTETHFALVTGPDGTEGQVYYDILIEALQADDVTANGGDNNYCNGTPNGQVIAQAFANHGITLVAATNLNHAPLSLAPAGNPVAVQAVVTNIPSSCGFNGAFLKYRTDDVSPWQLLPMTSTNNTNYTAQIPAQPSGTIIRYFVGLLDNNSIEANIQPVGANLSGDVNIPYYILVGFAQNDVDDFDNQTFNGNWQSGVPDDNATTGLWDYSSFIIPSYIDPTNPASMVQPGSQHTPGGVFCAFTGNAATANDGAGAQDVDNGKTTLISPPFDATLAADPVLSYYRWYSNDQGATPKTDYWRTYISGDNINWALVESTLVADHSWRMFAFRISDYTTPTSSMRMKFVAEDANDGSLIEAAVDDLVLWGIDQTGMEEKTGNLQFTVAPNPASESIGINIQTENGSYSLIRILDGLGRLVYQSEPIPGNRFGTRVNIPVQPLANGLYQIEVGNANGKQARKLMIAH